MRVEIYFQHKLEGTAVLTENGLRYRSCYLGKKNDEAFRELTEEHRRPGESDEVFLRKLYMRLRGHVWASKPIED